MHHLSSYIGSNTAQDGFAKHETVAFKVKDDYSKINSIIIGKR